MFRFGFCYVFAIFAALTLAFFFHLSLDAIIRINQSSFRLIIKGIQLAKDRRARRESEIDTSLFCRTHFIKKNAKLFCLKVLFKIIVSSVKLSTALV